RRRPVLRRLAPPRGKPPARHRRRSLRAAGPGPAHRDARCRGSELPGSQERQNTTSRTHRPRRPVLGTATASWMPMDLGPLLNAHASLRVERPPGLWEAAIDDAALVGVLG